MRHFMTKPQRLMLGTAISVAMTIAFPADAGQAPFQIRTGDVEASQSYYETNSLERTQIQMTTDSGVVEPYLNVTVKNNAVTVRRGEQLTFHTFWNYGAFISNAEIRIFEAGDSVRSVSPIIVPVLDGAAYLPDTSGLPDELVYVLRVYDDKGRFDETEAKFLNVVNTFPEDSKSTHSGSELEGYAIDRTAARHIKVRGANVTVYGTDVPEGGQVHVMGRPVPVDLDGRFMRELILPYGDHNIDVEVAFNGQSLRTEQDVYLDNSDFFYVAIGDLTVGTKGSVGPADFLAETDEDFDDIGVYGRGALYAKGRVQGDITVTAAVDTGEQEIGDIFRNLDQKDPRQLLRRLDSDRFYPVYGDDSQIVEDAPTQGRFYVRVEKDDSHLMWGSFATQITGTEFAHLDRGLYGAIGEYKSLSTNSSGDRRTHITGFAADPGTIPSREEFRGTGGSLYFLQRQDISIGSDRVRVEFRDKISGLVVETRNLRPQEDYDIDYIQGRILLSKPLQSFRPDGEVVRTSSPSGNEAYLVVRYEYTPLLSDVGGYTIGGRATQWLGDHVRIGATAQNENTDLADQQLFGTDILLRRSDQTYVKLEYAQTDGPGFGQSNSVDGGFNFADLPTTGVENVTAEAYRVETSLDLNEVIGMSGRAQAYFDHQDEGFSGAGRIIPGDLDRWGAAVEADFNNRSGFALKYDEVEGTVLGNTRSIYGDMNYQIDDRFGVELGIRHDDRQLAAIGNLPELDGSRTDASLQVNYRVSEHVKLHGFAQQTLDHDEQRRENDRYGIGGEIRLNDRLTLSGEVSDGDLGFGAQARAAIQRSDDSEFYLGYALSTDNRVTGLNTQATNHDGTLTVGARQRFNDTLSVYGEERYGHGGSQRSLVHSYGLNFDPTPEWSFGLSVENGTVEERLTGENFERTAFTVSAGRASDEWRVASNLEARFEDSEGGSTDRDRTTWLMRNTMAYDASRDWELLARLNFAISDSDQVSFLDADFVEGVIGAAYRPVENDRLNALLKYTYFENLAPAGQITASGQVATTRQKSQILSVDAIYDLTEKLSVGGKYGYRSGEVAFDRVNDDFIKSDAHLAVIRLDYHVMHNWDILAEGRWLSTTLADDERWGALAGVYRHLGNNVKVGVGYNFASFSDDLTDFNEDSDGFFVNVIGKF